MTMRSPVERGNEARGSLEQAETLGRLTCKWLCLTTAGLFVLVAVLALFVPEEFYNATIAYELWHGAVAAGLLLWGWRGPDIARMLAGVAVAAGMLYLAPLVFFAGLLLLAPPGVEDARDKIVLALAYLSLLVIYYGVALAFMRRAALARRRALLRRD
jgi:hypothetical protein